MASDHRGRELHAGKRTHQEMESSANAYARQGGWGQYPVGGTIYAKGQSPWNTAGMVVQHGFDEDPNDTTWQVNAQGPTQPTTQPREVVSTRKDLGRGKKAVGYEGSDALVVSGPAKTPVRGMIAAEAMKKRIAEGRDLKTGRPKK